ncbi:hypothetical protein N656DRAFT_802978 [Canariomyces notabilis]|uniref:Uncharacterized protein n=1 Tax=Canariomyces notabilis TaxID=2074819 RepID=A0AAN6QCN3_9PEZI|nr:hypothetical protein N656DRAFT_802978 [Canariomyces arenarius]
MELHRPMYSWICHTTYLVEQQADKEAKDNEDRKPLYHTAAAGHTATVQYLIM